MSVDVQIQAEEKFRDALAAAGIEAPRELLADGMVHRCNANRKGGKGDAWYVLHLDGVPAGAFGDWGDGGETQTWCSRSKEDLTPGEWAAYQARLSAARKARELEEAKVRAEARARALAIWDEASPCDTHPYLARKGVKAHGLKIHKGAVVIPLRDAAGELHSLEFIGEDGGKLFLTGGRKSGCWHMVGEPGDVICIAEGYATAASVHEATGYACAVAFDCGNLYAVATSLREKYAQTKLVICGDDDAATKGNPGATKAQAAAKACNGLVALPPFGADRPEKASDWNDYAAGKGAAAVREAIGIVLSSDGGPIDACDLFPMVLAEIEARKTGKSKNSIRTGIETFDRFTGGIRRSYLTVIAGQPGSGKTSAAAGIVAHGSTHGVPCYLVSLEMDRIDVGIRMVAAGAKITASDLFDDMVSIPASDRRWAAIGESAWRLGSAELTIDDRPQTITQIIENTHRWYARCVKARGRETGLVVVDYLGLIKSEDGSENRNREVAAMIQGAKNLAKALRIPVVMLSQVTRASVRENREPTMADLRDSGEIEAAADLIVFPYPLPRDEDGNVLPEFQVRDEKTGEMPADRWLVVKNRNGRKGGVRVKWVPHLMLYTDLEDTSDEPPSDFRTRGDFE